MKLKAIFKFLGHLGWRIWIREICAGSGSSICPSTDPDPKFAPPPIRIQTMPLLRSGSRVCPSSDLDPEFAPPPILIQNEPLLRSGSRICPSSDPIRDPWLLLVIKETFKINVEGQFRLDVCWNMFFAKPHLSFISDFYFQVSSGIRIWIQSVSEAVSFAYLLAFYSAYVYCKISATVMRGIL